MPEIRKILIANRGEIAVRIVKTCRKMGIASGAVFAGDDANSLHIRSADEIFSLGTGGLNRTYLDIEKLVSIANENNYDAVHPGYGFLSENPEFARACEKSGIIFIGPAADVMELMGDKIAAKKLAEEAGVPVLKSVSGTPGFLMRQAENYDYPILIKAAAGGGGKGMKIVDKAEKLKDALQSASREAKSYFGDERIFIEKYIQNPRHIEVQVLADSYGNAVTLFERECTLQRRHQKVIEEAPSPTLDAQKRNEILEAALRLVKSSGYTNAGTIEFLVEEDLTFWFLEMNARIQVEHPVTEMIAGIDLVEEQIKIARGEKLSANLSELQPKGHAIECRIYAEDPEKNFYPSPGKIHFYREPTVPDVRLDAAIDRAESISENYDPMIAKLITWSSNRDEAILKMISALQQFHVHGITSNIEFQLSLVNSTAFRENKISTHFIDKNLSRLLNEIKERKAQLNESIVVAFILFFKEGMQPANIWEEIGDWRIFSYRTFIINGKNVTITLTKVSGDELELYTEEAGTMNIQLLKREDHSYTLQVGSKIYQALVSRSDDNRYVLSLGGFIYRVDRIDNLAAHSFSGIGEKRGGQSNGFLTAPMPGKVLEVDVKKGDMVEAGQKLLVLEAMKMENLIVAPFKSEVERVFVQEKDKVEEGKLLVQLKSGEKIDMEGKKIERNV